MQRITIAEIRNNEWFKKDYDPVQLVDYEHVNLDDVYAAFDDPEVYESKEKTFRLLAPSHMISDFRILSNSITLQEQKADEQDGAGDMGPLTLNAFDLIILSPGLNLATLFDRGKVTV